MEHTLPSGEKIRMQKGIDPGLLVHTQSEPFSQYLVDIICTLVAEGGSLTEICTRQGMPKYTTVCRWRRQHPHIQEQLDQARRDRAEYLRDQALKEAEGSTSRDPIGAHALRVDTYLKAASFDDAKYSPKAKVEATITAPTQIIVSTGITREVKDVTESRENTSGNKAVEIGMPALDKDIPKIQEAYSISEEQAVVRNEASMDLRKGGNT